MNSPSGTVLSVEFLLDISSDVLFKDKVMREKGDYELVKPGEQALIRTFSILYSDKALEAMSTASCCIFSSMSAFLITAFRCSLIVNRNTVDSSSESG